MKRTTICLAVFAVLLYAGGIPAFGQRGHGGGPPAGFGGGAGAGAGTGMSHEPSGTFGPSSPANSAHSSQPDTGRKSVNDLLAQNTKLSSQISDLTGRSSTDACSGFKNLGQCVAAAHVSKNLGIPFDTLKGKVTGPGSEKLGQAIHDLNPNVDSKAEAKKGQQQAHNDLKGSNS
jgi:hypothetical protein